MKLDFKLYGNYCGPGWTRGKRHPESRMFELPFVAPIDELIMPACCMMRTLQKMELLDRRTYAWLKEPERLLEQT